MDWRIGWLNRNGSPTSTPSYLNGSGPNRHWPFDWADSGEEGSHYALFSSNDSGEVCRHYIVPQPEGAF